MPAELTDKNVISLPSRLPLTDWPGRPHLSILRGDLTHPIVSGNKLFKLIPIVAKAQQLGAQTLLSVGGRYSNHLHALSWLTNELGFGSVGLVRGFSNQLPTPTLSDCKAWGMQIEFVRPQLYRQRYEEAFWSSWLAKYPDSFRIDEGGWSSEAVEGGEKWWTYLPAEDMDTVVSAVGSGATLAGLLKGAPPGVRVVGVPVYRDPDRYQSLIDRIESMNIRTDALELLIPEQDRGFGKLTDSQSRFRASFTELTGVPTDPVYTAKVMHIIDHCWRNVEPWRYGRTVVIHTGGMQGNRTVG